MQIADFYLYNQLLDIYGVLLTEAQQAIAGDYYHLNLSLSEISENRQISRAAVSDALSIVKLKLNEYESKMGLLTRKDRAKEIYNQLLLTTDKNTKELLLKLWEVL